MEQQLFVTMAINAWNTQITRAGKIFHAFTDDELLKPVAPGKNRVIYLLGHLLTYHDMMAETLGIGTRHYHHLDNDFIINPDKKGIEKHSPEELKQHWDDVHQRLTGYFAQLQPADWFKRHNAVNDEDFAKDPTRNRLNLLMNRTGHVAYHLGQVKLAAVS